MRLGRHVRLACLSIFFCRSNGVDASFLAGSGFVTIVISFCRHEVEVLIENDFYLTTRC